MLPFDIKWFAWPALVLVGANFFGRFGYWFWPHNLEAILNEAALALLGVIPAWLTYRYGPFQRRLLAFSVVWMVAYMGPSATWVSWSPDVGVAFENHKHYRFSPRDCAFLVRFPVPPAKGRSAATLPFGEAQTELAVHGDLPTRIGLRAECSPLLAGSGDAGAIRAALDRWAAGARMSDIEVSSRDGDDQLTVHFRGRLGGIDPGGEKTVTRVEAVILVGGGSLMVAIVTVPESPLPSPPDLAEAFLASLTRR
ncbi:MAG: hypothetical protein FJX47_11100 [Alphaproteobacteria bacterium]|nr:hypothetical protein [Alphaproteobacteria bacterium]